MAEMKKADVGLVGLAVMGQNLVLNLADHGYHVAVYNRTADVTEKFVAANPNTPGGLFCAKTIEEFVGALARPRKIILLVKAGSAVDAVLTMLKPLLDKGDIVVDGGNSLWTDTIMREGESAKSGICFFGCGVSGGEEGARFGPSLMPGGSQAVWNDLKPILENIAAKVDPTTGKPLTGAKPGVPIKGGVPCVTYIGENGAGHYVKMVHNGIEYGDMQLICEAYFLMRELLGMKPEEMSAVFGEWNKGDLDSFLVEITTEILKTRDPSDAKTFLVDKILDAAGQKGTGKWTSVNALDLGVPAPAIAEAVFARCMSALKDERVAASKVLPAPAYKFSGNREETITAIRDALYASKICSYAQGFALMAAAAKEYKWNLRLGEIAMIWRGGCIIRARFLDKIREAYANEPGLQNLLLAPYFRDAISKAQSNWRRVVSLAAEAGVSCPQFMASLSYYDSYRSANLPANLLQAQRDFFGAHTFERTDKKRGEFFHHQWN